MKRYLSFTVQKSFKEAKYEIEISKLLMRSVIKMIKNIINKVERGGLLSLKDLRNIANILTPRYLPSQEKYLGELEHALRKDIATKVSRYGKEVTRELLSIEEIRRLRGIDIVERIRKYVIAECGLEFKRKSLQVGEKLRRGEIDYEGCIRQMNDLYKSIYSWCPGSQKEFDFVERPFLPVPIPRKTDEYIKRFIEPKIEKMVQEEMKILRSREKGLEVR